MTVSDWLYLIFAALLIPYIAIGIYGFALGRIFIFKIKTRNPQIWDELGRPSSLGSNMTTSLAISKYFIFNSFSTLNNNPKLLRWAKIIRFCSVSMYILTPIMFITFACAIFF